MADFLKDGLGGVFVRHQHVEITDSSGGGEATPDANKENTIAITNTGDGGVVGSISHGANGTSDASTITIDSSANKAVTDALTAKNGTQDDEIAALTTRVTNAENAATALEARVTAAESAATALAERVTALENAGG